MANSLSHQVDPWGRVIFLPKDASELLMRGYDITTLWFQAADEIASYNALCEQHGRPEFQIPALETPGETPEQARLRRSEAWLMPARYREIDVRQALLERCVRQDEIERVNMEMDLFEARGLNPVLQLMFYLVDVFRANGIVWGVGRGSSVASYCLFLIGIHRIDSIAYDLDIGEFLKGST